MRCTSRTSTRSDWSARLRQKWETDRQEIEQSGTAELRRLRESWSNAASSAQRSIGADTAAWTGRIHVPPMQGWLLAAATGLSLLVAICGAGSGTMRWLSKSIENRLRTLPVLNMSIDQDRQPLARFRTAAWRVERREIDGGRLAALPAGSMERPPWTVGGPPAVKLSSE